MNELGEFLVVWTILLACGVQAGWPTLILSIAVVALFETCIELVVQALALLARSR